MNIHRNYHAYQLHLWVQLSNCSDVVWSLCAFLYVCICFSAWCYKQICYPMPGLRCCSHASTDQCREGCRSAVLNINDDSRLMDELIDKCGNIDLAVGRSCVYHMCVNAFHCGLPLYPLCTPKGKESSILPSLADCPLPIWISLPVWFQCLKHHIDILKQCQWLI